MLIKVMRLHTYFGFLKETERILRKNMHKNNFVMQAFCSVEDHSSNWPFKILLLCVELQDHALKEGLGAL